MAKKSYDCQYIRNSPCCNVQCSVLAADPVNPCLGWLRTLDLVCESEMYSIRHRTSRAPVSRSGHVLICTICLDATCPSIRLATLCGRPTCRITVMWLSSLPPWRSRQTPVMGRCLLGAVPGGLNQAPTAVTIMKWHVWVRLHNSSSVLIPILFK